MRIVDIDTGFPVSFVNSNGVTFGVSGDSITASISPGAAAGIAAIADSAGSSVTSGTVQFSNANGVSFGFNGSTMTASVVAVQGIAAGTQTNSVGTVIFSNSNNVSFGMSGSATVTASAFPDTAFVMALGAL